MTVLRRVSKTRHDSLASASFEVALSVAMHGVSEPIPRKGSGDAQPPSRDFASVRVVEMGESLTPDPLRGIGSVISVYSR